MVKKIKMELCMASLTKDGCREKKKCRKYHPNIGRGFFQTDSSTNNNSALNPPITNATTITQVCKFGSSCTKGDACPFVHEVKKIK